MQELGRRLLLGVEHMLQHKQGDQVITRMLCFSKPPSSLRHSCSSRHVLANDNVAEHETAFDRCGSRQPVPPRDMSGLHIQ